MGATWLREEAALSWAFAVTRLSMSILYIQMNKILTQCICLDYEIA